MKPIKVVQYGSWGMTHAEHTMLCIDLTLVFCYTIYEVSI